MKAARLVVTLLAALGVIGLPLLAPGKASAHPFFNTTLALDVHDTYVHGAVEIPVSELGLALHENLNVDAQQLLPEHGDQFKTYLAQSIKPTTTDGKPWKVVLSNYHLTTGTIPYSLGILKKGSTYQKLAFDMRLTPPPGGTTRTFNLGYTAVVKDVPAHSVLVSITQDWASGINNHAASVGTILYDFDKKRVTPMRIDLSHGNLISGYIGMVKMGMEHIRTGTDHLLFLLTLLLPAPLIFADRKWRDFGGVRRTLKNILKITTAFTIGHSCTLIIATLAHLHISQQPVEALIAVSIIVSAVHALRPIFPGKEMWVAAGFGLIHGTAFSFVLADLNLNSTQTAVSLFGFNVGIELMQLAIIAMVMPSLIVFAKFTNFYPAIRIGGSALALVAAVGWLGARLGYTNPVGSLADSLSAYAHWSVIALGAGAVVVLLRTYYEAHPIEEIEQSEGGEEV